MSKSWKVDPRLLNTAAKDEDEKEEEEKAMDDDDKEEEGFTRAALTLAASEELEAFKALSAGFIKKPAAGVNVCTVLYMLLRLSCLQIYFYCMFLLHSY